MINKYISITILLITASYVDCDGASDAVSSSKNSVSYSADTVSSSSGNISNTSSSNDTTFVPYIYELSSRCVMLHCDVLYVVLCIYSFKDPAIWQNGTRLVFVSIRYYHIWMCHYFLTKNWKCYIHVQLNRHVGLGL